MTTGRIPRVIAAALLLSSPATVARAVDTITAGAVGSGSTTIWPVYIGIQNGFFDAVGIKVDPVFAPSSTAIAQQVAAGSTNLTVGSGIVDPIRAIDKGAPIAIWRVDMQAPPYALLGQARDQEHQGPQGQDHQHRRRQGHHPHLRRTHAGAERHQSEGCRLRIRGRDSARLSALQSGAVDAAILTSPHNFYAEAAGFTNLGWTIEYAKELPFSGAR